MPNRELILEMNSEQTNLARTGVSDASDAATIQVAGDTTSPAAVSGESATQIPLGIKIEWLCPSTNSDGTTCVDLRWSKIYYKSTTGVTTSSYDGTYVIASRAGENAAFSDTVAVGTARYYIITALDNSGNESTASGEVDSTGGGSGPTTNIPDDADGVVFDDDFETEGVGAGDGAIGIVFQVPPGTWSEFDHYRLWYDTDTGGGFSGSWTEIVPINRTAYIHKGLNTSYLYKYKAYIVAEDGTESTDPDYATNNGNTGDGGPGYQPNQSDNSIFDGTVLVGNLVAVNEVRGEHFFAESFLAINDTTFGNNGIQLQYNGGTPRAYIGDGSTNYIQYTSGVGLTVSGAITASSGTIGSFTIGTYLYTGSKTAYDDVNAGIHLGSDGIGVGNNLFTVSAAGAMVSTSATITGVITANTGYIGGTSGWTIASGKMTASGIGMATTTGDATYAFWAGNDSPASAEFRVTHAGVLYASGATISGTSTWTGNSIATTYTAAKCTDANADQTSANTAAAISGQGNLATRDTVGTGQIDTTVISGGKIVTGLLTASNIQTGTLNASLITVSNLSASSITTGTLNFSSISRSSLSVLNAELAGSITYDKITSISATTITTGTLSSRDVRTAASSNRVQINATTGIGGTAHTIGVYDSYRLRGIWSQNDFILYSNDGSEAVHLYATTATTATPVLYLDQNDLSEPFIEFQGGANLGSLASFTGCAGTFRIKFGASEYKIPFWTI